MATQTVEIRDLQEHPVLRHRIAAEVRAQMARRQVSGASMAVTLGKSQKWMSRRTTGEIAFDMDDLEQVAKVLEVDVEQLLRPQPTVYRHREAIAA